MTTLTGSLENPNSFHPISQVLLRFGSSIHSNCSFHLVYQLPPSLFIDPYELAQRRHSYRFLKWGPTDLEKPVHAVDDSETTLLVSVTLRENTSQLDIQVPLHARYGVPLSSDVTSHSGGNYHVIHVAQPRAFITCPPDMSVPALWQEESLPPHHLSQSQYRDINFAPKTRFFHTPHSSPNDHLDIVRIPIGYQGDLPLVQLGTAIVILLSFFWVATAASRTSTRLNTRTSMVIKRE